MASIVKIKRSSVQGKKPTTSEITGGELALNTRDGKLFSSDGTTVFEVGANVHSLAVGSGGLTFANGAMTLPSTDGADTQILATNGSGTLSWVDNSSSNHSEHDDYVEHTSYFNNTRTATALTVDVQDFGSLSIIADPFGVSLISIQDLMEPVGRVEEVDLGGLT